MLSVPDNVEGLKDTLTYSVIESSVKQSVPYERMASPVSVAYLDELEARLIDSPKKLSAIVPNLHIPDYGSANTVSARASIYRKTENGLAIGAGVGFKHSDGYYANSFDGENSIQVTGFHYD